MEEKTHQDSEYQESEYVESIAGSQASTAAKKKKKKKPKSSVASTAASTGSTAKRKKKKDLKSADTFASELDGMSTDSETNPTPKKKKTVPKKVKRKKVSSEDSHLENDDAISCLTENTNATKKKKKKKKTKTKSKDDDDDEEKETNTRPDSASNLSEGSKKSKSTVKKKKKHKSKNADDGSISAEKSTSKRKKRSELSKLNERDKIFHSNSKEGGGKSVVSSALYSRSRSYSDDDSSDNSDNDHSVSSRSRRGSTSNHSRTSGIEPESPKRRTKNKSSPPKGKGKVGGRDSSIQSRSSSHRRNPHPVRIASKRGSVEVRSASADNVREMQMALTQSPSRRSGRMHSTHSPRGPPQQRGVNRYSSAPLRSSMRQPSYNRGGGRGRGPQQVRTSYLPEQHQNQRRPPPRTNSKNMTPTEHVVMLKGVTMQRSPTNRGHPMTTDFERQRSLSQPPEEMRGVNGRRISNMSSHSRSLSPSHSILRNSSSHSYDRSRKSYHSQVSQLSKGDIVYASDINDTDDDEDFVGLRGDGSEHDEDLNDSQHHGGLRPRSTRYGLNKSSSNDSVSGFSTHSTHSFLSKSNRSQMSIDGKVKFENDPKWKVPLRYIRLLPPHQNETKLKKKIRIFTWISMSLDFIAAIVALAQYTEPTTCCGEPIFRALLDINWSVLFQVVTVLYLCMIFLEIIPVVKNGIPFNIVNPTMGFLITFGMFFDDSVTEAVAMWIIEVLAIFFEFLVYRVNARMYFETTFELKQVDEELEVLKAKRKQLKNEYMTMSTMHGSRHVGTMHSRSMPGGSMHSRFSNSMSSGSAHSGSMHSRMYESRYGNVMKDNSRDVEMGARGVSQRPRSNSRDSYDDSGDDDDDDDDDDDESLSGHSFGGDEEFYDEKTPSGRSLESGEFENSHRSPPRQNDPRRDSVPTPQYGRLGPQMNRTENWEALGASNHSYGGTPGNRFRLPGEVKQNKLLRRRRVLRENKKAESKDLYYHFVGSMMNIGIAIIAMIFIVTIASTGGMCFRDGTVKVFSFDQFDKCDLCTPDRREPCEQCTAETSQCYYPYIT